MLLTRIGLLAVTCSHSWVWITCNHIPPIIVCNWQNDIVLLVITDCKRTGIFYLFIFFAYSHVKRCHFSRLHYCRRSLLLFTCSCSTAGVSIGFLLSFLFFAFDISAIKPYLQTIIGSFQLQVIWSLLMESYFSQNPSKGCQPLWPTNQPTFCLASFLRSNDHIKRQPFNL